MLIYDGSLLSGHLPFTCGWLLNRGSTVVRAISNSFVFLCLFQKKKEATVNAISIIWRTEKVCSKGSSTPIPIWNSKLFMQCRRYLLSWIIHQVGMSLFVASFFALVLGISFSGYIALELTAICSPYAVIDQSSVGSTEAWSVLTNLGKIF